MPWIIYRHLFKDLLKLLTVSSLVLVLVISFAAAIKPLSEGLLGPMALVKYVFYMVPTMLGFILPFSGTFAGTLVFSRFVSDNELLVCRAAGISYRAVLLPVVFLGLILTLGLFYLSNWVVPSFYREASFMLEKDMMQVVVSQVERMRPVTFGDMVLYADAVDDTHPPPVIPGNKVQPVKLIRLRGVALGRLDDTGRLRSDSTAQKADVLLYRVEGQTWATMQLDNVVFYDAARGSLFSVEKWVLPQILLPNPLKDNPRFLSWPQMRDLGDTPELYDEIRQKKQRLIERIVSEQLLRRIQSRLTNPDKAPLELIGGYNQERYQVTAPLAVHSGRGLELTADGGGAVRVEYTEAGGATRRIDARRAEVWIEPGDPQPEPWVRIELEDAKIHEAGREQRGAEHEVFTLPRCRWPVPVMEPLKQLSSSQLLSYARSQYPGVELIRESEIILRDQIIHLFRRIVAQLNERAALAVACLLVLILSAVLSMRLGGGMPLVIYFWSFLSATIVVIICHSGENLASQPEVSRSMGLFVIWLGNLLLVLGIGGTYLSLARN